MGTELTPDNILKWLKQESNRVIQNTAPNGDPLPYLWSTAVDTLEWLNHISPIEKDTVLKKIHEYLSDTSLNPIGHIDNGEQVNYFTTLLQFIAYPPNFL